MRFIALILTSTALIHMPTVQACPAFLWASELNLPLPQKRSDLRLFSLQEGTKEQKVWVASPLQVDPMSDARVLLTPEQDGSKSGDPVTRFDRLSFRMESFGFPMRDQNPPACVKGPLVELQDPLHPERFAYLGICEGQGSQLGTPLPVSHDAEAFHIKAGGYSYDYQPNNQLMYKSMRVRSPSTDAMMVAGQNANMLMHLDIKSFFTLDFDNKDVSSYVAASHNGPIGLATKMDFYLSLLFFKIDLKMATTATFFNDSAHIPMLIDVPVNSKERLHPGSGVAYTWDPAKSWITKDPKAPIPTVTPETILKGWDHLAPIGLKSCQGSTCRFRLNGRKGDRQWHIDLILERYLVENGFFPIWVPDVAAFTEAMDWDTDPEQKGKVAIYFDNTGLPKGEHSIDQWVRLVPPDGSEASVTCPAPVRQRRTVETTATP